MCNSFKQELLQGLHNFTVTTGNVFKAAFYNSTATGGTGLTAYSATNEVSGTGYTAGGYTLTNITPVLDTGTAIVDFADVSQSGVTLSGIRGMLIYNSTNSNRAVAAFDFGSDQAVTGGGTLQIVFPAAAAATAIIRIA
jgi:hypothetical protein